jgi:glycosyltransferase involved in cell wall biosynthesis
MKILAIYPGLNPMFDEVAHTLPSLVAKGMAVRVITSKVSALKSTHVGADFENFGGVEIFRFFPTLKAMYDELDIHLSEIIRLIDEFKPDVMLVNSFHCLPLLARLRDRYHIPVLLRVESAAPILLVRRRYYLGIPALGHLIGKLRWWQVSGQVDAVMTNDPADLPQLASFGVRGRRAYYAAHCAQRPADWVPAVQRKREEMIYVGSLIRHKNCSRWLETVPAILEQTPVERFTIIGRGPYLPVVEKLKQRFGNRIEHVVGVTRLEALQRISEAYFAYTESTSGWGFLCDAWSTDTPILCPQSNFNIVPDWTGMMPQNIPDMVVTLNRLYSESDYYKTLQEGGRLRYTSEHTAEIVAKQYAQILRAVGAYESGSDR